MMVYSITSYRDKKIILYRRVMEMTLIDHHLWRIEMNEKKMNRQLAQQSFLARHKLLRRLGFKVYVLDNIENITHIIDEIEKG